MEYVSSGVGIAPAALHWEFCEPSQQPFLMTQKKKMFSVESTGGRGYRQRGSDPLVSAARSRLDDLWLPPPQYPHILEQRARGRDLEPFPPVMIRLHVVVFLYLITQRVHTCCCTVNVKDHGSAPVDPILFYH